MHAIDTPDKQFKDGNGTSELGTILPAWWLNQIQAELLAVLTAANIQPNKAKTNQIADAIKQIFSGAVVNNLTSDNTDKPLSAAMGKKLQDEALKKEGNQEISGSTLTVGNRSYPGYRLWSTSGNEGLLIESSGINTGHKFIIRRHNNGTFESSNIRSFSLPAINGDYTLAPAGLLTNQDLNTLTVPGLYGQNSNSNAQIVRNYPVAKAGSLLVLPSAYGVQQIYSVFDGTDIYTRNQNSGGWTAWQKTNVSPAEMQAAIAAAQPEKSDAVNLDDSTKLATAKAVKTLHDKIDNAVPSGKVAYFAGRNAPAGWLKANGAAVSRTIYADLFAAIGTTYGAGDGRTTFNLPDIRGEFVRGWDDGRNIDRGRAFGSNQSDNIAEHRHATGWRAGSRGNEFVLLRSAWSGQSNITADVVAKGGAQIPGHDEHYVHVSGSTYANSNDAYATSSAYYDISGETRSRNIAQLAIIKI